MQAPDLGLCHYACCLKHVQDTQQAEHRRRAGRAFGLGSRIASWGYSAICMSSRRRLKWWRRRREKGVLSGGDVLVITAVLPCVLCCMQKDMAIKTQADAADLFCVERRLPHLPQCGCLAVALLSTSWAPSRQNAICLCDSLQYAHNYARGRALVAPA